MVVRALESGSGSDAEAILAAIADGYLSVGRDWRCRHVNAAAARLLGCAPETLLGESLWKLLPGLAGQPFERLCRDTLAGGAGGTRTAWYPDHARWYELSVDAIPGGLAIGLRDVTEREHRREAAQSYAGLFARLADDSPFGIYVVDDALRIAHVSREARRAFANVPDVVGRELVDALTVLWGPDKAAAYAAIFRRTLASGEPHAATRTVEQRADNGAVEAYAWRLDRVLLPDGRFGVACYYHDITEQQRAEAALAALAASERRFRAVQECSVDGFMLLESVRERDAIVDFRWTYANEAASRMAQAPPGGFVGRRLLETHPGNREEGLFDAYVRVVETGEAHAREFVYHRDGLDLALRLVAVKVDDGLAIAFADRREAQQLAQRLADSERRARLALEAMGGHVFEMDYARGLVRRAPGFGALLGYAEHEIAPSFDWWHERMLAEDRPRIEAIARAVLAAREPRATVEYRVRHRDGREVWLQENALIEYGADGRPRQVVGCTFEIDARKRAELELEAANARLEEATLAAGLGIHEYYPATGRLVWDARMRDWWGLGADEPVTYQRFVAGVHPDDRAAMQAAIDRALDPARGGRYDAEYRVVQPGGRTRWVQATGAVAFEAGRAVRLIGTVQDVTEARRLADQLREADRRKDEFLATLSHELRNPLAPIRTAVQLLDDPRAPAAQLGEARRILRRQVEHMALLLDDLLDLARITQGKLVLRRGPARLDAVVAAAVEAVRPAIDARRHRLSVTLPPAATSVDVDPLRIAQVLSNLLHNAAKYTDPGGHLELEASVHGAELRLLVRDDGIGLAPAALAQVFRMFAQVEGGARRAEGGLGIGLALVEGLVRLHGGAVAARSEGPGRGSEFEVRLPVVLPAAALPAVAVHATPAPVGAARRVVVVDDNRDAARTLALLLEMEGHAVRVAHGGLAALELLRTFRPEVALVDIGLPDLDGHAVARALRAEPWGDAVELIALTGWGQGEDRRRSLAAGFDLHLTKPVDPEELLRRLRGTAAETRVARSGAGFANPAEP